MHVSGSRIYNIMSLPGNGVVQAISLGRSNCTGLRSLAASASCCSGLDDVNGKIGIMGGIYLLLRPLLPLLVDEASSSFYKHKE